MKDSFSATCEILQLLGIPHSRRFLKNELNSHPEPESMLAISDTLSRYKVDTLAVQITADRLEEIPLPCIVQMHDGSLPYFSVLESLAGGKVGHSNPKGNMRIRPLAEFLAEWSGVALLLESDTASAEPGYATTRKSQRFRLVLLSAVALIALVLSLDIVVNHVAALSYVVGVSLILALKLCGLSASAVLLWSEVDKGNPAIRNFCGGGKNLDCEAVTASFAVGGQVSLGILSFAYFFGGAVLLVLGSFSDPSLQVLRYLGFSALVIIPLSLYFQGIRLRKWCKLCLIVLLVLGLEFMVFALLFGQLGVPSLREAGVFGLLFLSCILAWLGLKPYLSAREELQKTKSKLARLLSNQEVFDHLLAGSRGITHSPQGLGISLRGKRAKFHILKVCNPYCGPCAKTHPVLEELFESGNIDLQVIFHPGTGDEPKLNTIRHILAVTANATQEETKRALDDWYLPEKKDYAVFAAKYPINGELKAQEAKIQSMLDWCERENISYTPTIFVNGRELPKAYAVEDLKHILV